MKILCVIDSLGPGGAQRQLVELGIGFKENGHKVTFLVYHLNDFFKNILDEAEIPVHSIIEPNYLKRLHKMRKYIRSGNYDAVLSFLEAANFICEVAGLPMRRWKLVVGERSANPNILRSFKLRFYRWFHIMADYIVANSFENIRLVRKINPLLSSKKCYVIRNTVDLEKWKPSENYVPCKKGKFRLVVAASHQYSKNLNGLIDAVSLLDETQKEKLVIEWYGDKLNEPYIDNSLVDAKRKIKDNGFDTIFKFFPATHDLKEIISNADGVGLFSKYEGFPNIICEGMACMKPVICSNISDVPHILYYDNSLLFDASQSNSIASSLRYLLRLDPLALVTIAKTNREIAVMHFDKKKIIKKYLNLLS